MLIKGYAAAIGFAALVLLCIFSMWAEWGPYAWATAAQMAIMDSYGGKLTFVLTLLMFALPAIILLAHILEAGRGVQAVAFGIPAVLAVVHFAATVYFLSTGGPPPEKRTLTEAGHTAGFLPRSVVMDARELGALNFENAAGIKSSRSSSDDSGTLYIAFAPPVWPDAGTPVVLKSDSFWLKHLAPKDSLEGTIYKAPLPYLVRRAWKGPPSTFVIIVAHRDSVREYWGFPGLLYAVGLIWGGTSFFKSRRNRPPANVAPHAL